VESKKFWILELVKQNSMDTCDDALFDGLLWLKWKSRSRWMVGQPLCLSAAALLW